MKVWPPPRSVEKYQHGRKMPFLQLQTKNPCLNVTSVYLQLAAKWPIFGRYFHRVRSGDHFLTLFPKFSFRVAVLAGVFAAFSGSVVAQSDVLAPIEPSATGSYLAGQQAFEELRTTDAASFYMDAAEVEWDNVAIVERAFIALAADGRVDDAASLAQHLIDLEPENEIARLLLGTVALKERRYSAAKSQLENIGTESFLGITAAIVRAWALVAEDNYASSSALLDELSRGGLDDFLTFHRALMADVAGERDIALEYAASAYETDPFVARVVEAYARMLGNASRFAEARRVLDDYETEGLTHPLVLKVAEAIKAEKRPGKFAATAQAGTAEMFQGIGSALAADGSVDLAVVFLRLGLFLDPKADILAMTLAQLFESAENYDAANALYDAIAKDSPMKDTALVRMVENIDASGQREEAIRRLKNITVVQPDNADAFNVLGNLYRVDERYIDAVEAYTRVIELVGGDHPRDWRYYYVRGMSYERADKWPEAEADFLKALELNPGQPQVLNYLGYSWVDKGMNLDRALGMIREAVQRNPGDGYTVDSLGWVYYKLGRLEEAVLTLEQAVRLLPNDPEINDHLGDAYWKVGRYLEARFQWTIAIDVDEEGGMVTERATVKLANGLDAADG